MCLLASGSHNYSSGRSFSIKWNQLPLVMYQISPPKAKVYRPPQSKIVIKILNSFSRTLSVVQVLTDLAIEGPFAKPPQKNKKK